MNTTPSTLRAAMTGLALFAATALCTQQATAAILVQDSFDASGYTVGANLKNLKPGVSTGFGAGTTWGTSSSTGVFYVNDGLTLPDDFIAASSGQAIGVGKFTSDGGVREISRPISPGIINNTGTYYIRFACAITASAESYLGFKGFELFGLLPEAHTKSDAISYPASNGLQFGFYKFGYGDNKTALVVLKEGGQNANVSALKLVDPVVPGKTYIVVAKVVLDGQGGAEVYAMAGATDDADFRFAELPSTPLAVTVSTSPLRYLVYSGTFMTGYNDGKWASFDEFAIGENLDDVFGFKASTAPVVAADSTTDVGETGFTANGRLVQAGEGNPEVFFDISADGGETFTSTSLGSFAAADQIVGVASGLFPGATYAWRFRGVGQAGSGTTEWQSVTLAGAPALGEPTAVVADNSATLSVSLVSPGLSGTVATTVELWFAPDGSPLDLEATLGTASSENDFSRTISNLDLGKTYNYAFRATVPYDGTVIETWTATNSFSVKADIEWTGSAGTDWNEAANWLPQVVPITSVSAYFRAVGGDVTATANGEADGIHVNTTGDGTEFRFGANSLTAGLFHVGSETSRSAATLAQGDYEFDAVKVGFGRDVGGVKDGSVENRLLVASGANLGAGSLTVGYNLELLSASNTVTFATGSKTEISGDLTLSAARGTKGLVEKEASLSVGSLVIAGTGASMTIDGGSFTNTGNTIIMQKNEFGHVLDPIVFELKNGAKAKFNNNIYVHTGRNADNKIVHGELHILSGSEVDATGKILYIDDSTSLGPHSDIGDGVAVIVSNATMKVKSITICNDQRHHDALLLVHADADETAKVTASENLRIAASTGSADKDCNYGHRLRVEGADVTVMGTLFVGNTTAYYTRQKDNRLEISGAKAAISAKNMDVSGLNYIEFEIPEGGYADVPLKVTQTANFGIVPAGQDAASWTPVSEVRVDASNFTGTQMLLRAGSSIAGLDTSRVKVTAPSGKKATVSLTGTELSVTVSQAATIMLFR